MGDYKFFSKPIVLCITMLIVLFYSDKYIITFISYNFHSVGESLIFIIGFLKLIAILILLFFYNKESYPVSLGVIKIKTVIFFAVPMILILFLIKKETGIGAGGSRYIVSETTTVSNVLIYISVFAIQSIVQDIVFFGVLFNNLKKYSKLFLFSVPAVFFVIYNAYDVSFGFWLPVVVIFFSLSVILLMSRIRTKGILLPIILHSIFNVFYINIEHFDYNYGYDYYQ
ncbi:CPBP family intramembrane glutamic endopeptidase [Morganella morganii]|uniref:CPBP family intramembrane glutamic endopeptidase n=1 Tax=Morganella morganii TaxID=582 RepID=UPI0023679986|nr:CPBP family intramembrane glutamic endopeptidase [Morganella morganii]